MPKHWKRNGAGGSELFTARWEVSPGDSVWVRALVDGADAPPAEDWALVSRSDWGGVDFVTKPGGGFRLTGPRPTQYSPLEDSALYRTFATTERTKDGILGFANRYGLLGGSARCVVKITGPGAEPFAAGSEGEGEPLGVWLAEIDAMAAAVEDWRLIRMQRVAELRERLGSLPSDLPSEVFDSAAERLALIASNRLAGQVSPEVSLAPGPRVAMRMRAYSLLAALWLGFLQSTQEDREYRTCARCEKWFEVSRTPTGFRADRKWCSDSCKSAASQDRRKRALLLAAEGVDVHEIARRVGTDLKRVNAWLSRMKNQSA